MDENRTEGGFKNIAGKVEDAVGGLTGDTKTQASGKARQAEGQLQQTYGQMVDTVSEHPVGTTVIVGLLGLIAGMMLARR